MSRVESKSFLSKKQRVYSKQGLAKVITRLFKLVGVLEGSFRVKLRKILLRNFIDTEKLARVFVGWRFLRVQPVFLCFLCYEMMVFI
jgi:hypothetical protein